MGDFNDEIIAWDDEVKTKTILERHLAHVKNPVSAGCDELLGEAIGNLIHGDHIDWFLTDLSAIAGMEVEGEEISIAFLYFNNGIPDDFDDYAISTKLAGWLDIRQESERPHFGLKGFMTYRRVIRQIRNELVGWVTGKYLEPILILAPAGPNNKIPCIKDIRVLAGKKMSQTTAHQAYKKITENSEDSFVAWIKPAAAIRIYNKGLYGQVMRLRDARGWASRHIGRIIDLIMKASAHMGVPLENENICRTMIVEPIISISEARKGCTLAVMKEEDFQKLVEDGKIKNCRLGCKPKHFPKNSDLVLDPLEAEYENYLTQDGAVVLSPKGKILGLGTYFIGGPGGRKSTARWLPTAVPNCISIVTGQDGPIYLHWSKEGNNGEREELGARLDFLPSDTSKPIGVEPDEID